ncbi:zinc ribbon domain-containing protein YjdM [Schleiferiaceae bacterium]|nr:zinc ribbon domain-containing protein YjdM [Schleiferiaceae bacterium]
MSDSQTCPECNGMYAYPLDALFICPECGHEWNAQEEPQGLVVIDVNGNRLQDGDSVTVIKSLPVKGAPKPIKPGTKISRIKLADGDHNISCKVDGFGSMMLKSEFVKKV